MAQLRVGPIIHAIDTTNVIIWVELSQACIVTPRATPYSEQRTKLQCLQISPAFTNTSGPLK